MEQNVIKERNKKRIKDCLSSGEEVSTTAIAIKTKIHYYYVVPLLEEMCSDGGLIKIKRNDWQTFWRLKK